MKAKTIFLSILAALCLVPARGQQCEINLAVLPVIQGDEIPEASQQHLTTALERMITAEGISNDPALGQFFIAGKFSHLLTDVTAGPPQQHVVHTYLTLYIGDLVSQNVYATTQLELRGVGNSPERAIINAFRVLNKRNGDIGQFIETGRAKVLQYYDSHYPTIIAEARRAANMHNYDEAIFRLIQIPTCCKGYSQASRLLEDMFQSYIDQQGLEMLNRAKAEWAAQPDARGAERALTLLLQIDPESAAYSGAEALLAEIKASVKSDRDFELREKYHDQVELEQSRIEAMRQIGVAYGRGQQPTTTNLMWLK